MPGNILILWNTRFWGIFVISPPISFCYLLLFGCMLRVLCYLLQISQLTSERSWRTWQGTSRSFLIFKENQMQVINWYDFRDVWERWQNSHPQAEDHLPRFKRRAPYFMLVISIHFVCVFLYNTHISMILAANTSPLCHNLYRIFGSTQIFIITVPKCLPGALQPNVELHFKTSVTLLERNDDSFSPSSKHFRY